MLIEKIPAKEKDKKVLRVGAYARVSTDKDAAFHSLTAQEQYYKNYIEKHKDWQLVEIYSDNGISGTIVKRPAFQKMLADCRARKIDLIITKSITRFARNTVTLLKTIRELKSIGVEVYFEKENMYATSAEGELALTLIAMYAEEEARVASENKRWSIAKKFERGEPTGAGLIGYRYEKGKLVVVPEEARIVKQIFDDFLSGKSYHALSLEYKTKKLKLGKSRSWSTNMIKGILTNEKYVGDLLLQKTYRPDFRTKKVYVNKGEVRQYYVQDAHEPIISREMFEKAQAEVSRRQAEYDKLNVGRKRKAPSPLTGFLTCGICGKAYCRRHNQSKCGTIWRCSTYHYYGKTFCPSRTIPENVLLEKVQNELRLSLAPLSKKQDATSTLDIAITKELLDETFIKIIVYPTYLKFKFHNGTEKDAPWEPYSRSRSWTPKMREAARKRAIEQNKKRKEAKEDV